MGRSRTTLQSVLVFFQVDRCALIRGIEGPDGVAADPRCLCGRPGAACPGGNRLPPLEPPVGIRKALRERADTGLFQHGRTAAGGPRGQEGLDRTGNSIDFAHPDLHRQIRRVCDYRQCDEEQTRLAGGIHPPAAPDGRDPCQCPGAQAEQAGSGGTAQVRDGPGRDLGTFCQPACRPGGQRNHGGRAPHLRVARSRYFGDLAVVVEARRVSSSSPTTTAPRTVRNLP